MSGDAFGRALAKAKPSAARGLLQPGDAQAGRDVPQAHPGLCAMHRSTRAWLARKDLFATSNIATKFWKSVASFWMRA
jgi:hypothetical protein